MPFLRVVRDKRGYETTYLMHWYREGNRQRSRILYVFRTPGGVSVGREPMAAEVRRAIETHHPGIAFDWNAVIANQQIVESAPERRPRKRRAEESRGPEPAAGAAAAAEETPRQVQPSTTTRFSAPSEISGATPDEQIAFLDHWYPLVRDHVVQHTTDPARLAALRTLAERLNPAPWIDADQIAAGLSGAAEALERLTRIFARRRRRPRRNTSRSAGTPPVESPPSRS